MQIRRDYSKPFFSKRHNDGVRTLLYFTMLIVALFVGIIFSNFDKVQLEALKIVGMAPTATLFSSEWASRGYTLSIEGKLEEAAISYANAVSQQPDNINYIYEYGMVLIELNRERLPGSGRQLSDLEISSQLGDHGIVIAPTDVRSYTLKAKTLVWLDDASSAIPVALQGLEFNPGFAPLLAVLARAYTDIGRYEQALTYGERAISTDPLDSDARRSYAIALIFVGRRDEAITQLEDAIKIRPNLPGPYFELAIQYRASQRYEDAIATYLQILVTQPRNSRAQLRLCETLTQIGQLEQAEGYCDDAISSQPTFAQAYRQLGMVNYRRRNYEGAIENFEKCIAQGSTEVECWYLRGLAHYYLGDCEEAWAILTESLPMVQQLAENAEVIASIQEGLRLTTISCSKFSGRPIPTLEPDTVIPTPIG